MADEYIAQEAEKKWQRFWEKEQIYKFDEKNKKGIFKIDTPPPTLSGRMHIGHAFSYSQQDFIARFRRMFQGNIFYPFGTDDDGLPTERMVEKIKNISSKQISRSAFIEICMKTIKEITPEFVQDWKNLGISCDYKLYYSTINKNVQKISQKSFIELFKKGEIYQKELPTLWCPECRTAIAQAELEDKEQSTFFTTLKFKANGKDLLIATTRPELLGACVAVFVNPADKRYKNLVGKKAKVPRYNFEVPIIADKSAEMEKGTGVLMICSYGDKYDVEAINRHKLKPRVILDKDGRINSGEDKGLFIKAARKKILQELQEINLIAEQKSITNAVNVHDKCGTEIEFFPTKQWFIKVLDKKKQLVEQGRKIKWHPNYMLKRYENWVNGLEWDWNISRDRHFGIPIPVWECNKCDKIILAEEKELPVDPMQIKKKCPSCGEAAEPEQKVLDTWATSSLTPQIASSLVENKVKIPFSLRPQAHDIIRTWAFYTIVRSYLLEKEIPWEDIMISGFVTLQGEKMSKSKGNVIDPSEVLKKYSSDALRFWAAGSTLGEDLDYQEKDIITGQKFITKIWNASKFAFMNLEGYKQEKPKNLEIMDKWIISKLNNLVKICTGSFENYEFSRAKAETENFFWHTFCDNYLEIIKKRIYEPSSKEEKISAQYALYQSLFTILKLMAPIMPHITEELYQKYYIKNEKIKSIHINKWPEFDKKLVDEKIERIGDKFIEILGKVRQIKTKNQKSLKAEIILTVEKDNLQILNPVLKDLKAVVNAKEIKEGCFDVMFV